VRNDVPQTVGEALKEKWEWLSIRCVYCRKSTRVPFAGRDRAERLASIINRMRCTRCKGLTPCVDVKIGRPTSIHEKPIGVEGNRVHKIGMN